MSESIREINAFVNKKHWSYLFKSKTDFKLFFSCKIYILDLYHNPFIINIQLLSHRESKLTSWSKVFLIWWFQGLRGNFELRGWSFIFIFCWKTKRGVDQIFISVNKRLAFISSLEEIVFFICIQFDFTSLPRFKNFVLRGVGL